MKLYTKIYNDILNDIQRNILKKGDKLLSIRQMVEKESVSRTTVQTAYDLLVADGYVSCKSQSGYYVNESILSAEIPIAKSTAPKKYKYDFSGKYMETFDFTSWRKIYKEILDNPSPLLAYGDVSGELALRSEIANYLSKGRGIYCSSDNIIIGSGVQSLLHIICPLLEKKTIAFENPGFKKGHIIFSDHNFPSIFLDGNKINYDNLIKENANILYISPSNSFPLGVTLPYDKRIELLHWAKDTNSFIFEDDYDGELKHTGKPLISLKALDRSDSVIYLGSFSKLLPPSVRVSYAVLPNKLLDKYNAIKSLYNQTSATIEQLILSEYIKSGMLEKQIRRLRKIYARKNQMISDYFIKFFGDKVSVFPNDTGLHLTVKLNLTQDVNYLREIAKKHDIYIQAMSNFSFSREQVQYIYISCSSIKEAEIETIIKKLSEIWF